MKKSIYEVGEHRREITREQYHNNKKRLVKDKEIAAVAQRINMNYFGYRYYVITDKYNELV